MSKGLDRACQLLSQPKALMRDLKKVVRESWSECDREIRAMPEVLSYLQELEKGMGLQISPHCGAVLWPVQVGKLRDYHAGGPDGDKTDHQRQVYRRDIHYTNLLKLESALANLRVQRAELCGACLALEGLKYKSMC